MYVLGQIVVNVSLLTDSNQFYFENVGQQVFDCVMVVLLMMLFRPQALPRHFDVEVGVDELPQFKISPVWSASVDS